MTTTKPTKPKEIFPITNFISDLPTNKILLGQSQTPQSLSTSQSTSSSKDAGASPGTSDTSTSGQESANASPSRNGRLIIIGDIHGMKKSLDALLKKVNFDQCNGDHLILVGDLINKGPDSAGVVKLAMKTGASAVRGNHENAVLHAAAQIDGKRDSLVRAGVLRNDLNMNQDQGQNQKPGSGPELDSEISPLGNNVIGDMENFQKVVSADSDVEHSISTYTTALNLSRHQLEWLASLPLILRVDIPPNLKSSEGFPGDNLIVVHAGLVPNVSLQDQDPHSIMHMRSFQVDRGDAGGGSGGSGEKFLATEDFGDEGWVKEWDLWQEKQAEKTTVIFGHDAKRRLQMGKYSIGLDSACLYGHRLSALVLSAEGECLRREVVQVDCCDEPVVPTVPVPVKEGDQKDSEPR